MERYKVLGICGSLRAASYNRSLLENARQLAADSMDIVITDTLPGIPPFNEDVEQEGIPPAVAELQGEIAAADGILIATPEYSYGVPGVLKNAIDWAARPIGNHPLIGKPTALMGASVASFGTVRAQTHLRETLRVLGTDLVLMPDVLVFGAGERFSTDGRLCDDMALHFLGGLLEQLRLRMEAGRERGQPANRLHAART